MVSAMIAAIRAHHGGLTRLPGFCRCECLVAEPGWWAGQRWSGRSR